MLSPSCAVMLQACDQRREGGREGGAGGTGGSCQPRRDLGWREARGHCCS